MGVEQAHLEVGVALAEPLESPGHQCAEHRGEAGETDPPGGEADVPGQLRVGGVDAAHDLGRAVREQAAGLGQPDAAADPLEQLRAGLDLEPREVVADRRLGVVQLRRGRRHRAEAADGFQDAQAGDVQHSSMLSMNPPPLVEGFGHRRGRRPPRWRAEGLSSDSKVLRFAQPFFVSQKISAISSILASSSSAVEASIEPLVPVAPASLVASLTRVCSCGYFSKCGGLK